ncbi:MAG: hypothetical protein ABL994_17190, partial [Verrucomicrobiales bacterium]
TGVNEVQTISTLPGSGTFTLNFGGIATGAIAFNADAATIQTALEAVLGTGNVLVTGAVAGPFTVTFQGALANMDVPTLASSTTTIVFATGTAGQGGVVVTAGAALELDNNVTISGETVAIGGTGILNAPISALVTSFAGTGALRSISGTNTWNGSLILNGADTNTVSVGAEAGNLTINGNIFQQVANINLLKVGSGTLETAGAGSNAYGGSTFVNAGTLLLNKTGAAIAIRGTLHVGDNRGGGGADIVRYGAAAGTNQISDVTVVIHSSGLLDLNGISDTINTGSLILTAGQDSSGELRTGGGVYSMNNIVNTIVLGGTTSGSAPAVIKGSLNLGGGERNFDVRRSGSMTHELDVQASVINGGINKVSNGALLLSGSGNNYAGGTSVFAGKLIVGANGALGTTERGTLVSEGASLIFPGGVNYTAGEVITVVGRGFAGEGVIQNFGVNSFNGNILGFEGARDTSLLLTSQSGSLTVGGSVTLRDVQMEVDGAGDLTLVGGIKGATLTDGVVNGFEQRFHDLSIASVTSNLPDL